MLTELRVRDLGVIADLTLRFQPGMTVLTGETGAGKTLLVQALQLVLGGRASSSVVRAGAEEALVEARFVVERHPAGAGPATGTSWSLGMGDEVVLARAVPASGRSRAWIDGRMAPVAALAEVGATLVDIHGQHDHQSLLAAAAQRAALDEFAGCDLAPLAEARRTVRELDRRLADLGGDERDRARQVDLLRYQVQEIDTAAVDGPDEEKRLAEEAERLSDAAALRQAAAEAVAALDPDGEPGGGPDGASSGAATLLGRAIALLGGRGAFDAWDRRLRGLVAEVSDVAAELRVAAETWEDDPERLEEVQQRRRLLGELRRKYGATLDDVLTFAEDARRALDDLEHQEELAAALEAQRKDADAALARAAAELRSARAAAAPVLARAATARLRTLAMPDATVDVSVGSTGAGDSVQFLLGANPGEPLQPLARVASGGELARTMLALRLVVEGGAPTMLFDEVDAGVGGGAALALAKALREVASTRQVLVVTHLPQVAAFADHQVAVRKDVGPDGRTETSAETLDAGARVVELSRMLSGHPDSPTARAHAEELLLAGAGADTSTTTVGPSD